MFTTNPTPQFCRRLVGIAAWSVPCPAGWKKWMIYPPYPGGSRGGSSLPSRSLIQPGGTKWMSYQPYQGGSSGGSPCQSRIQPDGRRECSIHHVQVEAVEALGKVSWTWWRWFLTGISQVSNEVGPPDLKTNYNHNPSSDYGEVSKMLGNLANLCLNQILLSLFFQEGLPIHTWCRWPYSFIPAGSPPPPTSP